MTEIHRERNEKMRCHYIRDVMVDEPEGWLVINDELYHFSRSKKKWLKQVQRCSNWPIQLIQISRTYRRDLKFGKKDRSRHNESDGVIYIKG